MQQDVNKNECNRNQKKKNAGKSFLMYTYIILFILYIQEIQWIKNGVEAYTEKSNLAHMCGPERAQGRICKTKTN